MVLLRNLLLAAGVTLASCRHVRYHLHLTWELAAPDGNERYMTRINGKFPGPTIHIQEGDHVEVTVKNDQPFNTTVHFHGIEQHGTPWSDGVPGVSQKPIESGCTFVYRWVATAYGTYWYHAHSRGNIQDGLIGPIIVDPKHGTPNPFHLISNETSDLENIHRAAQKPLTVFVSDWDHLTSEEFFDVQTKTGLDLFCVDSVLINGKGSVNCQSSETLASLVPDLGPIAALLNGSSLTDKGCLPNLPIVSGNFQTNYSLLPDGLNFGCKPTTGSMEVIPVDAADEWATFHFYSGTSLKTLMVSIDEHPLWIYAVDGRYIEPRLADSFLIYNGERYSAMVKLDKPPGDYTIRAANAGGSQVIAGFATLSYKHGKDLGPSKPYITYAGTNTTAETTTLNLTDLIPFDNVPPSETADSTFKMALHRVGHTWAWSLQGNDLFGMNQGSDHPLLFDPDSPDFKNTNLTIRTQNGTWVDIVFQIIIDAGDPLQPPHVLHKHSNKAYIIGNGLGPFNWTNVAEAIQVVPESFNLVNPIMRDTFITSPAGQAWTVIRYQVVNPGAFLMHCHIETHLEGGMAIAILDGIDHWPTIPEEYQI